MELDAELLQYLGEEYSSLKTRLEQPRLVKPAAQLSNKRKGRK